MKLKRVDSKLTVTFVAVFWAVLMVIPVGVGGGNLLDDKYCGYGTVTEGQQFKTTGGPLYWNCEYEATAIYPAHKTSHFILPIYLGLGFAYVLLITPSLLLLWATFKKHKPAANK